MPQCSAWRSKVANIANVCVGRLGRPSSWRVFGIALVSAVCFKPYKAGARQMCGRSWLFSSDGKIEAISSPGRITSGRCGSVEDGSNWRRRVSKTRKGMPSSLGPPTYSRHLYCRLAANPLAGMTRACRFLNNGRANNGRKTASSPWFSQPADPGRGKSHAIGRPIKQQGSSVPARFVSGRSL